MSQLPMTKLQQKGIKTQKKFVEMRIKTLGKASGMDLDRLEEVITRLYETKFGVPPHDWLAVYNKISDNLRTADLTINLRSSSWFGATNNHSAYTQMYERAVDSATGQVHLRDDGMNPPDIRGVVDDQVTLPEKWAKANRFSKKKKIYNAMSFSNGRLPSSSDGWAKTAYGDSDKTDLQMVTPNSGKPDDVFFVTKNPKFNPHAKQVFTALNYGRRLHGSTLAYGRSHLVLKPQLKEKALYFAQDTFPLAASKTFKTCLDSSHRCKADMQSSYEWIGHVVLWATGMITEPIFDSCYMGEALADTGDANLLLEAHIFSDIHVNRDVEVLYLARESNTSEGEWSEICANAFDWGINNNVRVLCRDN